MNRMRKEFENALNANFRDLKRELESQTVRKDEKIPLKNLIDVLRLFQVTNLFSIHLIKKKTLESRDQYQISLCIRTTLF